MRTRVFKSGNSLAIRIPKQLAIVGPSQEVEIERVGQTLVVRLLEERSLADLMDICALFSPDFLAEGRDEFPEVERDWDAFGQRPSGAAQPAP